MDNQTEELRALLAALWANRSDPHWCFEMSSTIEEAIEADS